VESGHLVKILWHAGIGMSLYAKRLEKGRFVWPAPADGTVAITPTQLAYMLEGLTGGTRSEPGGRERPAEG
jgi:transposase